MRAFRLAPMSPAIAILTGLLMLLPVGFLLAARHAPPLLVPAAILLVLLYAWVWLWFRPSRFEVGPGSLDIVWPLRRVSIPRADITGVRVLDEATLEREIGWGMRVGAGGLWGAFGWLYTKHRGKVRFYVSRTDELVWIERQSSPAWLVTPERPADFARALAGSSRGSPQD